VADASHHSEKAAAAHFFLAKVALGRTEDITQETLLRLGLESSIHKEEGFRYYYVRVYAFRKLGETGSSEAIDLLANLKPGDIGPDETQQIWPGAQVALKIAYLARTTDPLAKVEFLEKILIQPRGGWGAVGHWAVEELCERGSLMSIGIIHKAVRSRMNGERGEEEIRFCEARMRVISRDPDRIKALASVLRADYGVNDDKLLRWAIHQLSAMRTRNADAELSRFVNEVDRFSASSPSQQRLVELRRYVDRIQRSRM